MTAMHLLSPPSLPRRGQGGGRAAAFQTSPNPSLVGTVDFGPRRGAGESNSPAESPKSPLKGLHEYTSTAPLAGFAATQPEALSLGWRARQNQRDVCRQSLVRKGNEHKTRRTHTGRHSGAPS